jgi:hypothetical protein
MVMGALPGLGRLRDVRSSLSFPFLPRIATIAIAVAAREA